MELLPSKILPPATSEKCSRYILDENHNIIPEPDLLKWAMWMENVGDKNIGDKDGDIFRRVASDKLDGVWNVSTIFLGTDHNFGSGPPVLFESMIFWEEDAYYKASSLPPNEDGTVHTYKTSKHPLHNWDQRYHTYDEALAGHKEIVQHLLAGDMEWFGVDDSL